MKQFLRSCLSWGASLLAIAVTAACLRNVFWDQLEPMAATLACGQTPRCSAQVTRSMHTPIAHSYRFLVAGRSVEVECRRAWILTGDYACALTSGEPPAPAPAPSGSGKKKPVP